MLFNSFQYALFLPLCVVVTFLLPHRYRWLLLLAASYYFYMCWRPAFAALMAVSTLVDYAAAIWIARHCTRGWRWVGLGASLLTNLGLLFFYKYTVFFNDSLAQLDPRWNLLGQLGPVRDYLLQVGVPLGLSFYTFQTLSYTLDVFFGKAQPQRHLGYFALYVSFFPQLVAGPIERYDNLMPQLRAERRFDPELAASGLRLILWGLLKKVVVADNLARLVEPVYGDPSQFTGPTLLVATYCFAFQIYCDFSGYSDIAIGSARLLGVKLMTNFRTPYFAQSLGEFWSRWHISLSTWIRDYLYFPLGGNRRGRLRTLLNLLVVFLLSGLWHGANWTFVIWGAVHGVMLCLERAAGWLIAVRAWTLPRWWRGPLGAGLRILVIFHVVLLSWVFFRAGSLADALLVIERIATDWSGWNPPDARGLRRGVLLILALVGLEVFHGSPLGARWPQGWRRPLRWVAYYAAMLAFISLGVFDHQEFIYFQF